MEPMDALDLLQKQQLSVENQKRGFVPVISASWGIAWLLGFLAMWLIDGAKPGFSLPVPIAVGVFVILFVAASVASGVLGARSGRGIRNPAGTFSGTVYGLSWAGAMAAATVLGVALEAAGLSDRLSYLFFPSVYALVAGVLYLGAAALWHAIPTLVVGAWLLFVAAAAPFLGYPGNLLAFSIGGGGAFLGLAIYGAASNRRSRVVIGESAE
jgi:hypothetical protein